jgi:hypothetical protein
MWLLPVSLKSHCPFHLRDLGLITDEELEARRTVIGGVEIYGSIVLAIPDCHCFECEGRDNLVDEHTSKGGIYCPFCRAIIRPNRYRKHSEVCKNRKRERNKK